jgi:sRNA-binding protein
MLTKSEITKLQTLLVKASPDQMNDIARMFNDAMNMKRAQATRSFTVGQKVKWSGKNGPMSGTVIKVMKKNVRVKVSATETWNVTATMLKAA